MVFIYEKGTNKLVGVTTKVFDNGVWREATLEELYPNDHEKLGMLVMPDTPKYNMNPDVWQFELNEEGTPVGIVRKPQPPRITLTTDAVDTDGDGMPEIPADGESKARIFINIKDVGGQPHLEETTLFLRTTGGRLSARRILTSNGKAEASLTSVLETITITVSVRAENMEEVAITFELMPPG